MRKRVRRRSQTTSNRPAIHQAMHPAIGEGGDGNGTAAGSLRFAALARSRQPASKQSSNQPRKQECKKKERKEKTNTTEKLGTKKGAQN